MAINLHQLKIFHTVARSGSFSRAAVELKISQPSVSIQVGDLERQFGVELFEQAGKSVRMTQAGRILDDYAGRILALIDETRRAIDEVKGLRRGRLLIGATATPGAYLLPGLLKRFREQHAGVDLVLRIAGMRRIQELLLQRELDLGVVGARVTFPDLEAVPIATDELVLVTAPDHPFAAMPSVPILDLAGEPFILRERGSGTRDVLDDALHRAGLHIAPAMELEGVEMVKRAVAANLGVSVLSRGAVEMDVTVGRLRIVPVEGLRIQRDILLVHHRDRRLPHIARAFLEMVTLPAARGDSAQVPVPPAAERA